MVGRWISLVDGSELDALDELPAETVHVQFQRRLSDARFEHLAGLLRDRPGISLRVYHADDVIDLEFLRWFPGLQSFAVDAIWPGVTNLDGLRHVAPSLERLVIGRTKRPLSLAVLRDLTELKSLVVEDQQRDLAVLTDLAGLEALTLRSITLPDLKLLTGLERLRRLDLKLGGTTDLGLLPELRPLEELEIWQVRGLEDITPIEGCVGLRTLFLQALPRIREIPDLRRLTRLTRVTLHTMKGITDLSPLAATPALTTLMLVAMPQLRPEALRPLVGHPTLRRGQWNIGSMRQTFLAHDVLPIQPEPYGYAEWKAGSPYQKVLNDWLRAVSRGTREVDGRMVMVDEPSPHESSPHDPSPRIDPAEAGGA